MRSTTIRGLTDGLHFDFGGDVGLIAAVMEVGVGAGDLIYEFKGTGREVLEILRKHVPRAPILDQIVSENDYVLTAYDW